MRLKDSDILHDLLGYIRWKPDATRIALAPEMFAVLKKSRLRSGLCYIKEDDEFEYMGRRIYQMKYWDEDNGKK